MGNRTTYDEKPSMNWAFASILLSSALMAIVPYSKTVLRWWAVLSDVVLETVIPVRSKK